MSFKCWDFHRSLLCWDLCYQSVGLALHQALRCRAVNMNHVFDQGLAVNDQNLLSACGCPEYCAFLARFPEHYLSPVLEILYIDHGITVSQYIFLS